MASTLAHELNQPLMALSNFAAAAQALAQGGPPDLLVQSLQDVRAQAQRASEIVRRIRGMVRQGSGLAERFGAAELVDTVLGWLKPEITARRVRIARALPADLPPVLADRVLAEQLLLNLVLNALQALEGQPPERRRIEISARVDGARLLFSVADQGPGVAAEHAEQLFAPSSPPRPRAWAWA
jgi:C4-dicarboxylate-specific signal transduction histidine kinase